MSISPGILRRASPSNSRSTVRVLVAAIVVATLAVTASAQTIDRSRYAVLLDGPNSERGIDLLPPNVTPHWHATYQVVSSVVDVYYVEGPIAPAAEWQSAMCTLISLRTNGDSDFYYQNTGGWSAIFSVRDGSAIPAVGIANNGEATAPAAAPVVACTFAARFVDRFLYFQRTAPLSNPDLPRAPAMPAIVDLQ